LAKRGRKSVASNVVALDLSKARPRLVSPTPLTKAEAKIFATTAQLNPHLVEADAALLAAYSQAVIKGYRLAKRDDAAAVKSWDQVSRVVLAMSRALRLAPINNVHPETSGRRRRDAKSAAKPWEDSELPYSADEIDDGE